MFVSLQSIFLITKPNVLFAFKAAIIRCSITFRLKLNDSRRTFPICVVPLSTLLVLHVKFTFLWLKRRQLLF